MKIPFTNKEIVVEKGVLIYKDATTLFTFGNKDYPEEFNGSVFYPLGYLDKLYGTAKHLIDFLEVPELNLVINILAKAEASGIVDAYNKTTGKPYSNNDTLVRMLRKPNWFQGSIEFWRQTSLWRSIYGNEYIYLFKPLGMGNRYVGMFTLNPAMLEIRYPKDELFFNVADDSAVEYIYTHNGQEFKLETENVIHLNDNRVQANNILKGTSKLDSLQPNIKNIRAAYKKRNIALNMPIGILSNQNKADSGMVAPMLAPDKKETMAALEAHGALPILTGLALSYDALTVNSAQLGLFEEVREDTMRICDMFGVPYKVLSSHKGNTLSDSGGGEKESKKQMYEETAIPNMNERMEALNNHVGTVDKSWQIEAHYSHLPLFQEDKKQYAMSMKQLTEALSKAFADGIITKEQYLAQLIKFGIDGKAK